MHKACRTLQLRNATVDSLGSTAPPAPVSFKNDRREAEPLMLAIRLGVFVVLFVSFVIRQDLRWGASGDFDLPCLVPSLYSPDSSMMPHQMPLHHLSSNLSVPRLLGIRYHTLSPIVASFLVKGRPFMCCHGVMPKPSLRK